MKKKISHLLHQGPESLSYFFLHPRLVNIRYQDRLLSLPGGGPARPHHSKKDRWDPISIPHVKKQEVFGQVAGVYRPDLGEGYQWIGDPAGGVRVGVPKGA